MKPLVAISDLHTRFHTLDGVVNAVDGLDLDIFRGETLGLVGESGCGKSVTALSILQLLRCPPAEIQGRILFDGINLLDLGREGIRKIRGNSISMIFQEPMTSLNPVLTIGEQISEAIVLHQGTSRQEAWERAIEMLQMVQIPEPGARAREYPHKLSGGMRQRAMIAMALSCHPQLILADEPTTALDVTIQAQIMNLMVLLKEEFDTSIVLITHNLGIIAEMASRVVVMYAGTVVEEAPVQDLFKEPLHPYTQGLLGSIPWIGRKLKTGRRQLQEIPGIVPSPLETPQGCRFHPRCPRVMDICREQEPPMIRLAEHRRVSCWLQVGGDIYGSPDTTK
ncbi:MAG: ABC transporter ATP-binding protein [Deltaproteobacteria bacterium]|nr:ABC transporter ATP-binding protein [Deltaproteobacteria bacterium]